MAAPAVMLEESRSADVPELVPLSRCDLWSRQRAFYARVGQEAWPRLVPSFATSNVAIARAHAHVVLDFMVDCARLAGGRPEGPFHVLELGAGSGQFAFHFLRSLDRLLEHRPQDRFPFVYVMADFHEGALDAWRRHPDLVPFIERGILDFALFDVEAGEEIRLLLADRTLSPPAPAGPLVVLANYVFDSVSQDVFRVADGRLEELLVAPSPAVPDVPYNSSVPLSRMSPDLAFQEAARPYYGDADLDAVLATCGGALAGGYLTFPVGSLRCLLRLARCAGGRLLLLAADKAWARHLDLLAGGEPEIAWHHSFSMTVNFDAVGRLFERLGGEAVHQSLHGSVLSSAFLAGFPAGALAETRKALAVHLGTFSPGNLFALYRHLQATSAACTLDNLIGYLEVSGWDPHVFEVFYDAITAQLAAAGSLLRRDLAAALRQVAESFYFLPGGGDTLAKLGAVLCELGDHRAALALFERSLARFGPAEETLYRMGLCHHALEETDAAAGRWREALALDPGHILARGWLARLERGSEGGIPCSPV